MGGRAISSTASGVVRARVTTIAGNSMEVDPAVQFAPKNRHSLLQSPVSWTFASTAFCSEFGATPYGSVHEVLQPELFGVARLPISRSHLNCIRCEPRSGNRPGKAWKEALNWTAARTYICPGSSPSILQPRDIPVSKQFSELQKQHVLFGTLPTLPSTAHFGD